VFHTKNCELDHFLRAILQERLSSCLSWYWSYLLEKKTVLLISLIPSLISYKKHKILLSTPSFQFPPGKMIVDFSTSVPKCILLFFSGLTEYFPLRSSYSLSLKKSFRYVFVSFLCYLSNSNCIDLNNYLLYFITNKKEQLPGSVLQILRFKWCGRIQGFLGN